MPQILRIFILRCLPQCNLHQFILSEKDTGSLSLSIGPSEFHSDFLEFAASHVFVGEDKEGIMFVNVAAYVLDDSCLVFAGLFGGLGQCDCLV